MFGTSGVPISVCQRCGFFLLTLVAFALTSLAGGILWYSLETSSVNEIQVRVDAMKPVFTGIRLFLSALIAVSWPFVTNNFHRWGRIDGAQATAF